MRNHRAVKRRPAKTPAAAPAAIPADARIQLLRAEVLPTGKVRRFFSVDLSKHQPEDAPTTMTNLAKRHDSLSGHRTMKEFRLDEISAVDEPAQEGALFRIIKSASARRQPDPEREAPAGFSTLDEAVGALSKVHKSRTDVLRTIARTHPHLVDAYRADGDPAAPVTAKADDAVARFEKHVDAIRIANPRMSRLLAMVAARQRYPAAFMAAYGADT